MLLGMLILISIFLIAADIEVPSALFFFTALAFSIYLFWKWAKTKRQKTTSYKSNRKKEVIVLSITISIISVIAIVETYPNSVESTLFLTQILALNFLVLSSEQYSNSKLFTKIKSRKLYIILSILLCSIIAFLFVIMVYESVDLINLLALVFFIAIIVFGIKWLVSQIKLILNLKNEKAKTELKHLQNQVNPHFFFNVLNNLYGTVGKDPQQAQEIILKLSDMMRYSIYNGQKERATLKEEIEHLKNYIALNKMRYHKTIDIDFDINISDTNVKIVPLLYLMLLENAFKHGAEKLRKDAFIKIRIENDQNAIKFTVINNYDTASTSIQKGIGLKNLKRRLELAYPEKHDLTLMDKNGTYEAYLNLDIL